MHLAYPTERRRGCISRRAACLRAGPRLPRSAQRWAHRARDVSRETHHHGVRPMHLPAPSARFPHLGNCAHAPRRGESNPTTGCHRPPDAQLGRAPPFERRGRTAVLHCLMRWGSGAFRRGMTAPLYAGNAPLTPDKRGAHNTASRTGGRDPALRDADHSRGPHRGGEQRRPRIGPPDREVAGSMILPRYRCARGPSDSPAADPVRPDSRARPRRRRRCAGPSDTA